MYLCLFARAAERLRREASSGSFRVAVTGPQGEASKSCGSEVAIRFHYLVRDLILSWTALREKDVPKPKGEAVQPPQPGQADRRPLRDSFVRCARTFRSATPAPRRCAVFGCAEVAEDATRALLERPSGQWYEEQGKSEKARSFQDARSPPGWGGDPGNGAVCEAAEQATAPEISPREACPPIRTLETPRCGTHWRCSRGHRTSTSPTRCALRGQGGVKSRPRTASLGTQLCL